MALGKIIRNARIAKGISQDALAFCLGLNDVSNISRIEHDIKSVPAKHLRIIAQELELDFNLLLDLKVEEHKQRIMKAIKEREEKDVSRNKDQIAFGFLFEGECEEVIESLPVGFAQDNDDTKERLG